MNEKIAGQIAIDLLKLMRSGNDARTQIDFICNHLRIKKKEAAPLQKIFESGVHAGCDSVINGEKDSFQNDQAHPLYVAAYRLGREDFKMKLEEQRCKHKPNGIITGYRLFLTLVLIWAIIVVALLILF